MHDRLTRESEAFPFHLIQLRGQNRIFDLKLKLDFVRAQVLVKILRRKVPGYCADNILLEKRLSAAFL